MTMSEADDPLAGIDVEGPVLIEVFVLALRDGTVELTGPCGAGPWYIEKAAGDHPVDVVRRLVVDAIGDPELVHSTSWRQGDQGVILTFFVVIDRDLIGTMAAAPVGRVDLARSGATAAPAAIATGQVLEHAIRHLAWLARDDAVVRSRLSAAWHDALAAYIPEPFRNLG
ncbi:MAG: hypothetical protein ACRD12_06625 [Acidimicrobiales bacterium]